MRQARTLAALLAVCAGCSAFAGLTRPAHAQNAAVSRRAELEQQLDYLRTPRKPEE